MGRMTEQIERFERGELTFAGLVGDIDFLVNSCEALDHDWREKYDDISRSMEIIVAQSADGSSDAEPRNREARITQLLSRLRSLVGDSC